VKRRAPAAGLVVADSGPQARGTGKKEFEMTPVKPAVKIPQDAAGVNKLNLD
jgi:hypothetical protein